MKQRQAQEGLEVPSTGLDEGRENRWTEDSWLVVVLLPVL